MTKNEVKKVIKELEESSSCHNELACMFLEWVCDKYGVKVKDIDTNLKQEETC